MDKNYIVIHTISKNVDLVKDVGMIPITLNKKYQFKTKLVTFKNENYYNNIERFKKNISVEFVKKEYPLFAGLKYILNNAKKIDILNMYHPMLSFSLPCLFLYKLLNNKGISYLKLDLDYNGIRLLEKYNGINYFLRKKMLRKIDIISAESNEIAERFSKKYNVDVFYIPDGYSLNDKYIPREKQKTFLTVGRLGTEQKNTKLLVDAFIEISDLIDWDLELVGSITPEFKSYIENILQNNPKLKNRIKYLGEINDREKLQKVYNESSVFVLPSRWESFGIVAVEAMSAGNYLIVSDGVPPAKDFAGNENYGLIFRNEDLADLSKKMLRSTKLPINQKIIADYAKNKFSWDIICDQIYEIINEKIHD